MNNYGVLTTYNPYTKLWYAFNNEDVADYFSNPSKITYGEGKTAPKAMKHYHQRVEYLEIMKKLKEKQWKKNTLKL